MELLPVPAQVVGGLKVHVTDATVIRSGICVLALVACEGSLIRVPHSTDITAIRLLSGVQTDVPDKPHPSCCALSTIITPATVNSSHEQQISQLNIRKFGKKNNNF